MSRAPGKAPMVGSVTPRRMVTRFLARKRLAYGGESSSRPTASVPVSPVGPTEERDEPKKPQDDLNYNHLHNIRLSIEL